MNRLASFMREHYNKRGTAGWILKADVRKFFPSVDHDVLLERLRRVIPDPNIMRLLEMIIRSYNADTGKVIKRLRTQNKRKLKRRLKGLQLSYAEGRLEWEDIKRSMAATNRHLIH